MTMENLRTKLIYTAVVYYLFLQLALRFGIFGPTLTDLKTNLGVTSSDMSIAFAISCLGICMGAVSSGLINKFLPIELAASLIMLLTAVLVFFFATLPNFTMFVVVNYVVGFTSGAGISLCEAWIVAIWKSDCSPYMQALQFFRGLGYIIGPILADPFLSEVIIDEEDAYTIISNATNVSSSTMVNLEVPEYNANIKYPYRINSAMILVGSMLALALYLYRRTQKVSFKESAKTVSAANIIASSELSLPTESKPDVIIDRGDNTYGIVIEKRVKYYGYVIVLLSSVFYLFFYEEVIVTYLPLFATNLKVHLSKSQASLLASVFNIASVAGKAVSIGLALKMNHLSMLYMNLSIMFTSLIGLIIFANESRLALWIGICAHGVGLSNIVASLYTLLEATITLNPFICGLLNMAGTSGSLITPLIIGPHMDHHPIVLLYSSLVSTIGCITLLVVMHVLLRYKNRLVSIPMAEEKPAFAK